MIRRLRYKAEKDERSTTALQDDVLWLCFYHEWARNKENTRITSIMERIFYTRAKKIQVLEDGAEIDTNAFPTVIWRGQKDTSLI